MRYVERFSLCILLALVFQASTLAQSTELTFQGSLRDGTAAASGNFDFEFALFDSVAGGTQQGVTQTRLGVSVASGVFSVNLDFGLSFPGAQRFMEIRVRPSGGGPFTTLSPRQVVASAPYSIKSISAESAVNAVNAVTANSATTAQSAGTADTATTAQTAANFTGALAGDVTGTQTSTTVARIQTRNVANIAPTNGQVLKFSSANNRWEPATDETGSSGGGTITGVTAGTGLTGGGTTGSVAIAIANGGVATAQIADSSVTDAKIVSITGSKVSGAVSNSNQLGGVAASLFVQTNDPRLTDARTPTPGSGDYVQNTTTPQTAGNFNITGNGTAGGTLAGNIVNATTQYNIGGLRALAATGNNTFNTFVGLNSGAANSTGGANVFVGEGSGRLNSSGSSNTFVGRLAGANNSSGSFNTFVGLQAGIGNLTACCNSFFGNIAGAANTTGESNSFFGASAGSNNMTGGDNSFFGTLAGNANTASNNSFFGALTGWRNTSGTDNTFVGRHAGRENITASENSFFGANSGQLTTAGANSFFGASAGAANTIGNANSFFGSRAGSANVQGFFNSFFGRFAGSANNSGSENSFFGHQAGMSNTTASENSFFGREAGRDNETGTANSFFGNQSGVANTGSGNAFFGYQSGLANLGGLGNSFFGLNAGDSNITGGANTAMGSYADVGAGGLSNATAIGFRALAGSSNSLVLGAINGTNGSNADTNVGIGTTTPGARLQIVGGADAEPASGGFIVTGSTTGLNVAIDNNEIMARSNGAVSTLLLNADGGDVTLVQTGTGNVGIGILTPADKLDVDGDIRVGTSGTNGCLRNNNGGTIIGTCSSDIRFKRAITPFSSMLDKVSGLRPVNYYWRAAEFPAKGFGGSRDFGLIAQDVEQIMPELVSVDAQGYKQIDYSKLPLMTIQAVKELKAKTDAQQAMIDSQNTKIDALMKLLCASNKGADICRKE
jgi:Chaperone of endosialidase